MNVSMDISAGEMVSCSKENSRCSYLIAAVLMANVVKHDRIHGPSTCWLTDQQKVAGKTSCPHQRRVSSGQSNFLVYCLEG